MVRGLRKLIIVLPVQGKGFAYASVFGLTTVAIVVKSGYPNKKEAMGVGGACRVVSSSQSH